MTVKLSHQRRGNVRDLESRNRQVKLEDSTPDHKVNAVEYALQVGKPDEVLEAAVEFCRRMTSHGGLRRDAGRLSNDLINAYVPAMASKPREAYYEVVERCVVLGNEGQDALGDTPVDRAIRAWIKRESSDVGGADDLHWASMISCCAAEWWRHNE